MIKLILLLTTLTFLTSVYMLQRLLPHAKKRQKGILLDTSALIDGRIAEIVKSGFVPARMIVPRFVIAELQLLADKSDHLKRERARYGLSIIQDLQDSRNAEVVISSDDVPEKPGVDEKLVSLAKRNNSMLCTTDYNLLKVAEIEGVRVLNINELTQNLRPIKLPGETAQLKIVAAGQERSQGVGYLEDGTMVVVENAKRQLGRVIRVSFTRNLQTAAGRMMFAEYTSEKQKHPAGKPARPSEKFKKNQPAPTKR